MFESLEIAVERGLLELRNPYTADWPTTMRSS